MREKKSIVILYDKEKFEGAAIAVRDYGVKNFADADFIVIPSDKVKTPKKMRNLILRFSPEVISVSSPGLLKLVTYSAKEKKIEIVIGITDFKVNERMLKRGRDGLFLKSPAMAAEKLYNLANANKNE